MSCGRCQGGLPVGVGLALAAVGAVMSGAGIRARREVGDALARERVVSPGSADPPSARVTTAGAARSLAEVIRESTLAATDGRTYSETAPYLDADRAPTADKELAQVDERTGRPVANPDYQLWVQSTTLQTALMQAYVGFRVAEFTTAVGASLVGAGLALASLGRRAG
jgi:hypothetical protein